MRSEAGRLAPLARRALGALGALALASGCAITKASTEPARLAVHEDTLAPELVQTFVDARLKFVAHLKARGASDLRGTVLQIGDHTFWSMFTFHTWRDLDKHNGDQLRRTSTVDKAEAEAYRRDSDRSLVFPHKSELWREEAELEYGHPAPAALLDANVATLVIEDVRPTMDNQYWDAWPPIAKALEQVKYPLQRVTYFSSFGSGRMLSFWIAPSEAISKAAPPLGQALAVAVGEARAAELLKAWRDCVQATETQPVIVRHDMTSPP